MPAGGANISVQSFSLADMPAHDDAPWTLGAAKVQDTRNQSNTWNAEGSNGRCCRPRPTTDVLQTRWFTV